ncbi:MAG: Nif3-like dinuclear metal center hexameric protein [Capsulimonadaceae bacterium]
MPSLDAVLDTLRALAPETIALDGDPVGLLIALEAGRPIERIGVCLDCTPAVARRAAEDRIDLVITHHPLIYHPLKRITPETSGVSASVALLIRAGAGLYAMHTNWDRADGGINDTLAGLVGLSEMRPLGDFGLQALPRIGDVTPQTLSEFCAFVARVLDCTGTSALRVNEIDPTRIVRRVAVCGGAGSELLGDALAAGADAYVTADVPHHQFIEATARGLAIVDAGHGATERPGMHALTRLLSDSWPDVEVTWLED